jgi:hypothetical protein
LTNHDVDYIYIAVRNYDLISELLSELLSELIIIIIIINLLQSTDYKRHSKSKAYLYSYNSKAK